MADEKETQDVEIVLSPIASDIKILVNGKPVERCTGFTLRADVDGIPTLTIETVVLDGTITGRAIVETVEKESRES